MIELATVGELRSLNTELASRWDFFGIPNPDPWDPGSGFFILGLEIPKKSWVKNPENDGISRQKATSDL